MPPSGPLPAWLRAVLRPPYMLARRGWRGLTVDAPALVSFAASLRRDPSQIVSAWGRPGFLPGARAAVYVHFDPHGLVAPYVLHAMAELRANGFGVLFVTNSERLTTRAAADVQDVADGMLIRRNIGYDFGAMREGLAHWCLPDRDTEMVLLTNDSVLGPFAPLAPMVARLDFAQADFWAATDSPQRRYHLQSWWLAAGRRALTDPAWAKFWAGVRPVRHKEWVIAHYEIGLTRTLMHAGLRAGALWPYDTLVASARQARPEATALEGRQAARLQRLLQRGTKVNPTADLWRELLAAGCPFIKRELVTRNPARVADAAEWRDLVPAEALHRLGL